MEKLTKSFQDGLYESSSGTAKTRLGLVSVQLIARAQPYQGPPSKAPKCRCPSEKRSLHCLSSASSHMAYMLTRLSMIVKGLCQARFFVLKGKIAHQPLSLQTVRCLAENRSISISWLFSSWSIANLSLHPLPISHHQLHLSLKLHSGPHTSSWLRDGPERPTGLFGEAQCRLKARKSSGVTATNHAAVRLYCDPPLRSISTVSQARQ